MNTGSLSLRTDKLVKLIDRSSDGQTDRKRRLRCQRQRLRD